MEFIPLPHVTPASTVVLRQTVGGRSAVAALEGEDGYWLPDTVSCISEGDRSCPWYKPGSSHLALDSGAITSSFMAAPGS